MEYQIKLYNPETNNISLLPTLYSDMTDACVEAQNYVFNRQYEDGTCLFFRIMEIENEND